MGEKYTWGKNKLKSDMIQTVPVQMTYNLHVQPFKCSHNHLTSPQTCQNTKEIGKSTDRFFFLLLLHMFVSLHLRAVTHPLATPPSPPERGLSLLNQILAVLQPHFCGLPQTKYFEYHCSQNQQLFQYGWTPCKTSPEIIAPCNHTWNPRATGITNECDKKPQHVLKCANNNVTVYFV